MTIINPSGAHIPQLRSLWKTAFGDTDAFLDDFFRTAFSPARCRCVSEDGRIVAALYWFHATCAGQKFAYIYAVATDPACRGRGLCRSLMEDVKQHLAAQDFHGLILVPQKEPLRQMYAGMGYRNCGSVSRFTAPAEDHPVAFQPLSASEFAAARRSLLPPLGVLQEDENLALLSTYAIFCQGDGFLAAVTPDGDRLICHELLGNPDAACGLVAAQGCREGVFCTPGDEMPFAQYLPLHSDCVKPEYFGLAFD